MRIARFLIVGGALAALSSAAQAGYYTDITFVDPDGWNVGDAGSTHQIWDDFGAGSTFAPDAATSNPAAATSPSLAIGSPGFTPSGGGRTYSFMGNYDLTATVGNTTGTGTGTHVIVQVASLVNPDLGSVQPGSIQVLDAFGAVIAGGGENADLLRADTFADGIIEDTPFGDIDFEISIFEFFLPGYTGDFQVRWTQAIHTGFDALRVDSQIASSAFDATAVPEPASLALAAAGVGLIFARRR